MKILIGADLVPTESNAELFIKSDIQTLLGDELQKLLASADYRIFNLEVPLTDIKSPLEKCGPALIAPTRTIGGIKAMNPSLLCLANNHILDQGENGLASTTRLLNEHHIQYMALGKTFIPPIRPIL